MKHLGKHLNLRSGKVSVARKQVLPPAVKRSMENVQRLLQQGQPLQAQQLIAGTLVLAPGHPAVLALLARIQIALARYADAVSGISRLLDAQGEDVELLELLASAQAGSGDYLGAVSSLRRVCALQPEAERWLNLGALLDADGRHGDALDAAEACLRIDISQDRAIFLKARSLQALGRTAETAAQYRQLIAEGRSLASAWFGLLDIKTVMLDQSELDALKKLAADPKLTENERGKIDFAMGRALEQAGDFAGAFEAFERANRGMRQQSIWSAQSHHRLVDALEQAFARDACRTDAGPGKRGEEVIFIVGLPRSGSTVVEQILSAHSQVEGCSELPDLALILEAESKRRGADVSKWASLASAADWQRLGEEYLCRTARWRHDRPVSTDKTLDNWKYVGVIRLMLPGSVIIDSRRDAVETCWSCYKQLFAPGLACFTYSFDDLGAYWKDYLRLTDAWQRLHSEHFRIQQHEAMLANPETQIRDLLEFCGLQFEPGCLQPHESARAVRTASSAQVREPLRKTTRIALEFGDLLIELRSALV
ncbi:MAG: sulfotransferase [Dokdonella sp.]